MPFTHVITYRYKIEYEIIKNKCTHLNFKDLLFFAGYKWSEETSKKINKSKKNKRF